MTVIHGYQETLITCPHCGNAYGMRETDDEGRVIYRCWCGAHRIMEDE